MTHSESVKRPASRGSEIVTSTGRRVRESGSTADVTNLASERDDVLLFDLDEMVTGPM